MSSGASGSARTRYAILGCGSVGHAVAEELTERGKDVLILDPALVAVEDEDVLPALGQFLSDGVSDAPTAEDRVPGPRGSGCPTTH